MKKGIVQVALLVDVSLGCGRGISLGVSNYAATKGKWIFFPHEHPKPEKLPEWMERTRVDAVIAYRANLDILKKIRSLGIPAVNVHGRFQDPAIPVIRTDAFSLVLMALRFLATCGFRNLAFCGFPGIFFSDQREQAFRHHAREFSGDPRVFEGSGEPVVEYDPYRQKGYSPDGGGGLSRWLRSIPKPVGILACNDIRALQVINACRASGIRVPEDVAVIGVDNDEVLCRLSRPTLTSIEQDTEAIGTLAASLIDTMLSGRKVPLFHEVPPKGIMERQSTDVLVSGNPLVTKAARIIRDRIADEISIKELCSLLSVSRSTLDKIFYENLGRTASEEIHRFRMRKCMDLLLNSEWKIHDIARRCGFSSLNHLGRVFKRETGLSPQEFRSGRGVPSSAGKREVRKKREA